MKTANLDSAFAKGAKSDAGWMAFLAALGCLNSIYYLTIADVWWKYVIAAIAGLTTALLTRRGVARFYAIDVLINLLERRGQ